MWLSMSLFGRTSSPSVPVPVGRGIAPKLKNVCQPMKRRGLRAPPRRSRGSASPSAAGSKIIAKNGLPLSPARFARYDGRTIEWPKRYAAPWNSTGICATSGR